MFTLVLVTSFSPITFGQVGLTHCLSALYDSHIQIYYDSHVHVQSIIYACSESDKSPTSKQYSSTSLPLQALPYFLVFIILEATVRFLQHKPRVRVNDVISSLSAGVFEAMLGIVTGTTELALYIWVYEHCSIFDLPWDSPWTWWLTFLAVDFGYYWFHRMTHGIYISVEVCVGAFQKDIRIMIMSGRHYKRCDMFHAVMLCDLSTEVHFLWAAHQVHHSAEDYNIAVSLRQSAMQKLASWVLPFTPPIMPLSVTLLSLSLSIFH